MSPVTLTSFLSPQMQHNLLTSFSIFVLFQVSSIYSFFFNLIRKKRQLMSSCWRSCTVFGHELKGQSSFCTTCVPSIMKVSKMSFHIFYMTSKRAESYHLSWHSAALLLSVPPTQYPGGYPLSTFTVVVRSRRPTTNDLQPVSLALPHSHCRGLIKYSIFAQMSAAPETLEELYILQV